MLWTWWLACTLDPLPMPARPETSMLERWLDGPSWSAEGIATQGWPQLASSLSHTSGDVNGDGYADVAFGDPNRNSFGWVGVHLGGPTGPELSPSFTTPRTLGDQELGTALAMCDMDGDGIDDLVTSDPGANGGFGRIWLYLGSSHGLAPQPAWWTAGLSSVGHGTAGYSLTCSDLDGDGDDDLVVGEPTGVVPTYFTMPLTAADAPETASCCPIMASAPATQPSRIAVRGTWAARPSRKARHTGTTCRRAARRSEERCTTRENYRIRGEIREQIVTPPRPADGSRVSCSRSRPRRCSARHWPPRARTRGARGWRW